MLRAISAALLLGWPCLASGQGPGEPPASPGEATVATGQLTKAPELLAFVEAEYPPQAQANRITGEVVLLLTIAEDGQVSEIAVQGSSGHPELDRAASTAAARFRFSPAEIDHVPAAVQIVYRYAFTLEKQIEEVPIPQAPGELPQGILEGELLERGTRRPLAGVPIRVRAGGASLEAVSDAKGRFRLEVPAGAVVVVVTDADYVEIEDEERVEVGQATTLRYYLEPAGVGSDELVVVGRRLKKDVARRSLTQLEVRQIPGTSGDALKVIQNLPGVARVPFGGGALIIRGSNPDDSGAVINRHFVPLAFHFGGLRSVFSSALIESIDFYPGNFSAEYGRFQGGIIDVEIRRPKDDRLHGYVEADIFDAGVLVEGPLTAHSTFALAGRRSYIDALLPLVIPDDAAVSFSTVPRYWDYQAIHDWKRGRHRVRTYLFGSDDAMELIIKEPADVDPSLRGSFENKTAFYRLYSNWIFDIDETLQNDLSASVGLNRFSFQAGERLHINNEVLLITVREDLRWQPSDRFTLRGGLDVEAFPGKIDVEAPLPPREGQRGNMGLLSERELLRIEKDIFQASPGLWVEAQWSPVEALRLIPGLRADYQHPINDFVLDPRLNVRWTVAEGTVLKTGTGYYSQRPRPDEMDDDFGNPDIEIERSVHYMIGAEHDLTEAMNVDLQLFYKDMDGLVSVSDDRAERYDNRGVGRVYGLELLARHELQSRFFGWVSYTLMKAERRDRPGDPWRPFTFDQRHILTAVANYKLSTRWEVGARYRLVSGNPQTVRQGGIYDSDTDAYVPYTGPTNAERLDAFSALDLRIDRRWVQDTWLLIAYLEIQNTLNQDNQEAYDYNYDFTQRTVVTGMPIIPSFGIRGEF